MEATPGLVAGSGRRGRGGAVEAVLAACGWEKKFGLGWTGRA
jgi:hypothetical protein